MIEQHDCRDYRHGAICDLCGATVARPAPPDSDTGAGPAGQSPGGPGTPPGDFARRAREAARNLIERHGPAGGPARPRMQWQGMRRVDVTVSLPSRGAARDAAHAVARAAPAGATIAGPHVGYWEGKVELAYTVSVVGDAYIAPLAAAAHANGCTAVQVEVWDGASRPFYSVSEWRPADTVSARLNAGPASRLNDPADGLGR